MLQVVSQFRPIGHDILDGRIFRIQNAQGIFFKPFARRLVKIRGILNKIRFQGIPVANTVVHVPERVDTQFQPPHPEGGKHLHHQTDHLGNGLGRGRPKQLRAELGELPLAAGLRPFLAKQFGDVIQLVNRRGRMEVLLQESPHHSGRHFRPQGYRTAARIGFEREHLLADDIRRRPYAAPEQVGIFENRRSNFLKPVQFRNAADHVLDVFPRSDLLGKYIPRAFYRPVCRHKRSVR